MVHTCDSEFPLFLSSSGQQAYNQSYNYYNYYYHTKNNPYNGCI